MGGALELLCPATAFAYPAPQLKCAKRYAQIGGAYRNRTDDILLAKQALSQLS